MRRISLAVFLLPLLLALVAAAGVSAAGRESTIFTLSDPRGDDHGAGALRYPREYYGLAPGDCDLVEFSARAVEGGTEFAATFAQRIKPTANRTIDIGGTSLDDVARFGFYSFNLDIYIDTDRKPGSGGVAMLAGRRAEVREEDAWDRAVVLTPRPHEARSTLKRILLKNLSRELDKEQPAVGSEEAQQMRVTIPDEVERRVFFPNRVRVSGPTVRFFVPDSFLGGTAQPTWAYVVAVSGADIDLRFDVSGAVGLGEKAEQRLLILPVSAGPSVDHFGGGRGDDLEPPLVDLIVAPGRTQEALLSDYDPVKKVPVRLPGVVPAEQTKP